MYWHSFQVTGSITSEALTFSKQFSKHYWSDTMYWHSFQVTGSITSEALFDHVVFQTMCWKMWDPTDSAVIPVDSSIPSCFQTPTSTGNSTYNIVRMFSCSITCTVVAKSLENDTNINFHKDCCLSLYDGNFHILQNVMKSDQMICNSLKSPYFPCKWTEYQKNFFTAFQPCHKRTSWHHVSDSLVNTGVSADEDKTGDHSVMLIEFE